MAIKSTKENIIYYLYVFKVHSDYRDHYSVPTGGGGGGALPSSMVAIFNV